MQNWRIKQTAEGKGLTKVKTQRGIFLGDALSPFISIIEMIPRNHIHGGYKLNKSQETFYQLTHINDSKLFAENENELEIII